MIGRVARLKGILLQRCPGCYEGRVFRSGLIMNPTCPRCGVRFQREAGYFLGAMYFSYPLALSVLLPLLLVVRLAVPAWTFVECVVVACFGFLPFVPVTFRYSRVLWLHFDDHWDRFALDREVSRPLPTVER
jgi:uncharacterized protein (DUF983 family)